MRSIDKSYSKLHTKQLSSKTQELHESYDALICHKIAQLTADNSSVWSAPEHNRREFAHGFFQYPAMMVPAVQSRIIDIIKQTKPKIKIVTDPFMGSATSLVACMKNGLDCYGQDVNPLSLLIGETRTGPFYTKAIHERLDELFNVIRNDRSRVIEAKFKGRNKWFKRNVSIELSKIVRAIRIEPRLAIRRFYWVNLAETIRLTSNDRTSTFKLHARTLEEIESRQISPIEIFEAQIIQSIEDSELYHQFLLNSKQISKGAYKGNVKFYLQDSSKKIITPIKTKPYFDLLVTSPPYGDNKTTVTYGQYSYLPLQWIDLLDIDKKANEGLLKSTSEIDSLSLGGRLRKLSSEEIEFLCSISKTYKKIYLRLYNEIPNKANKVVVFLNDLYEVINRVFEVMKPNSYQVWTIGNRTVGGIEIPNNEILKEFIEHKGGKLVTQIKREILNKRMAKRNNNSALMNFEDILIFRKIG